MHWQFKKSSLAWIICLVLIMAPEAGAICGGTTMNPMSDVCWECIFPIKIAGTRIDGQGSTPDGGMIEPPDAADGNTICTCQAPPPIYERTGIAISFWEPARIIETVKDPFCFPYIGESVYDEYNNTAELSGANEENGGNQETPNTFSQAHYMIFPVWSMMEMLVDSSCVESGGFDIAYMTEFDPLWNDDELMFYIQPEALLFANPIAQFICMVDAVSSNVGLPLAPLFWCIGSYSSVYPLSGIIGHSDHIQSQAALAARMLYKLAREGLLVDVGIYLCSGVNTPIWVKWNYRLQLAKPVRSAGCIPIGRTGLLWTYFKNPPFFPGGDNFLFVIFRKRACCAS